MTTHHWVNAGLAILLSATTAGGVQFGAALQSHRGDLEYDGRLRFVFQGGVAPGRGVDTLL